MKTIRCGIVGAGFIGPHHVEAMRRLGFVEVVALCGSNRATAQQKAAQLYIPKVYDDYEAFLEMMKNLPVEEINHLLATRTPFVAGNQILTDR